MNIRNLILQAFDSLNPEGSDEEFVIRFINLFPKLPEHTKIQFEAKLPVRLIIQSLNETDLIQARERTDAQESLSYTEWREFLIKLVCGEFNIESSSLGACFSYAPPSPTEQIIAADSEELFTGTARRLDFDRIDSKSHTPVGTAGASTAEAEDF